jgi:ubiquitin-associated SH3 domain-containing protein
MERSSTPAELIVYACPSGPLAEAIAAFYAESSKRFGPNSAHAYPPHITLTGFFHDDAAALPIYGEALAAAHATAMRSRPSLPISITELATTVEFHGLLIDSPWLEALAADFAVYAASPTRRDALRLKSWLHLSLAYGFRPEDGPALGELARAMVDPATPVAWELRLYERRPGNDWIVHAAWQM